MRITEYIPGTVDRNEPPKVAEFNGEEDLLTGVDFVNKWREVSDFYRFSVSQDSDLRILLICELASGSVWYVVGYIDLDPGESIYLPEWQPKSE